MLIQTEGKKWDGVTQMEMKEKKKVQGVLPALAQAVQKPFSESRINPDLRSQ